MERESKREKHVQQLWKAAASKREEWAQPTKPYGFWTSDSANAKYNFNKEPGHMSLPGRGSPLGGETRLRMS